MTDRLDCPDCDGRGYQQLGPLRLWCRFCRGEGYVGDDNEPAHRDTEPSDELSTTPAWEQLGSDQMPGCRTCLGTGQVISLGGQVLGGTATQGVKVPCPNCAGDS